MVDGGFALAWMVAPIVGKRVFLLVVSTIPTVMHRMTVGMAETTRRKTRFPTVGTTIHAKAKPTATATAFCIYFIPL